MRKKATAKDVADAAGLSKWTVIRAFTPGASITEDSKKRVLEAAAALNYRPNLLARSLATKTTHQVAVLVDDFDNPVKLTYLAALTSALQARGLVALLININERANYLDVVLDAAQRQVDAVILFGTSFRPEMLEDKRLAGSIPIFVLARDSQISSVPSVNCAADVAIAEIGKHLLSAGYRRPVFLAGPKALSTALGRQRAYEAFFNRELGISLPSFSVTAYREEDARAACRLYFEPTTADKPDLVLCENDVLAYGAIDCLRFDMKLAIPQQVGVVGFDNAPLSAMPAFNLTSYEQPITEMLEAILDMIEGKSPIESCEFKGRLVLRGSTKV